MKKVEESVSLDFSDVLIEPKYGSFNIRSRNDVSLLVKRTNKNETCEWEGVPIMSANMVKIGTFEVAKVLQKHRMLTALHKFYDSNDFINQKIGDEIDPEYLMVSCGMGERDVDRCCDILEWFGDKIKFVCLDVANGYLNYFADLVEYFKIQYPNKIIIAGNVATRLGCLHLDSADFVKVGIGSGSVCTTRLMTGVGVPQFSLLNDVCGERGGYSVVSDGGCVHAGDIAKAFGIGAKFVMIGGMLANHTETGSELFGMSSEYAMCNYVSNDNKNSSSIYRAPEGKYVSFNMEDPFSLEITIPKILGGLRSTLTYTGNTNLDSFINDNIVFRVVNRTHNSLFDSLQ